MDCYRFDFFLSYFCSGKNFEILREKKRISRCFRKKIDFLSGKRQKIRLLYGKITEFAVFLKKTIALFDNM